MRQVETEGLGFWMDTINHPEHTIGCIRPTTEWKGNTNVTNALATCRRLKCREPTDGCVDGFDTPSDLCFLNNLSSVIGESQHYCAAQGSASLGFGFEKGQACQSTMSYRLEQNGAVSTEADDLPQTPRRSCRLQG